MRKGRLRPPDRPLNYYETQHLKMARYKKADWEDAFLEAYADCGNVTESASRANISRHTVYDRRKRYATFADAMNEAKQAAIESLEAVAWKRAKESSDTLIIFLLKSLKPEQYRDQFTHRMEGRVEYALTFDTHEGDATD